MSPVAWFPSLSRLPLSSSNLSLGCFWTADVCLSVLSRYSAYYLMQLNAALHFFFLYFSPSFSSVSSHIFRRSNVVWVTFKKYPKNHAHNWFTYSILFLWDFSELLARLFPARNFPRCSNHVYTWLFSRLLLQSIGDD